MKTEQTGQNPASKHGSSDLSVPEYSGDPLLFETLLDDICDRLHDTRQQGSLKRIRRLETILDALDKELNEL